MWAPSPKMGRRPADLARPALGQSSLDDRRSGLNSEPPWSRKSVISRMRPVGDFFSNQRRAGYTLLELMVVLAIIGALVGLATPPFLNLIEQQRRASELARVERVLRSLPLQARQRGLDMVLRPQGASVEGLARPMFVSPLGDPAAVDLASLPEGWRLETTRDLWVRYDGVCFGGEVTALGPDNRSQHYRLEPPICAPERAAEPS